MIEQAFSLRFHGRKLGRLPYSLGRIEPKLGSSAFCVVLSFAAALLIRRLKRAQAPHLLENSLSIQLIFQPLQRPIHRFTFSNNHLWHR
jgi:hypothetical protein